MPPGDRQFEGWLMFSSPQQFRLRAEGIAASSSWSNVVTLYVEKPTIASSLDDRTVMAGETVTLSFDIKHAEGMPGLRYEWFKDHHLVGDTPALMLRDVTQQDTGSYYLVIRDDFSTFAVSLPIQVSVASPDTPAVPPPPPPILHEVEAVALSDRFIAHLSWSHAGEATGFSVQFMTGDSGSWADLRQPFTGNGGTSQDFALTGSVVHFRARANSPHGPSVWSNVRSVHAPIKAPRITSQLVSRTVERNETAIFAVAATGEPPLKSRDETHGTVLAEVYEVR